MAKRRHVMTPARKIAIRKAQLASVKARKRRRLARNRGKAPKRANRGEGLVGLKRNFVPYARANKRSQTAGFNVGTIIPGTNKRIVFGGYSRFENTNKKNIIDSTISNVVKKIAPKNSRTEKVFGFFKKNVSINNPAVRASIGNAQVRLGTSRGAGPTLIIRRGRHKISQHASARAIKRYDMQARKLNSKRRGKPRKQRRNSNG